jgi:hypothetical protein
MAGYDVSFNTKLSTAFKEESRERSEIVVLDGSMTSHFLEGVEVGVPD